MIAKNQNSARRNSELEGEYKKYRDAQGSKLLEAETDETKSSTQQLNNGLAHRRLLTETSFLYNRKLRGESSEHKE